jgi:cathepsin C
MRRTTAPGRCESCSSPDDGAHLDPQKINAKKDNVIPPSMKSTLLVVLTAAAFAVVAADWPVHCLRSQILGNWTFSLGTTAPDFHTIDYSSCSASSKPASVLTISLTEPDVAVDASGNSGFWTLIYDQGIEITLGNKKMFWFFNYTQQGEQVTSYCGQSLARQAWFHDVPVVGQPPSNWGCFTASLSSSSAAATSSTSHITSRPSLLHTTSGQQLYTADHELCDHINAAQSSWRAAPNPHFVGKTIADLQRMSGARPFHRPQVPVLPRAQKKPVSPSDAAVISSLPRNWDWRNISGQNFVEPMRDQLTCGSCYAFAGTSMLAERIRIITGNAITPVLSPQDIVSCSPYSQGCDGGFAYLVSKYGEDFGIALEQCFPYQSGVLTNVSCAGRCTDPAQIVHVTRFEYVGGYFGACSEAAMMQEIYSHGPVAVGIEV